jgi:hypothetical protein
VDVSLPVFASALVIALAAVKLWYDRSDEPTEP